MDSKKNEKNEKFYVCINCDFNTCKKTDYKRHLSTDKHKKMENGSVLVVNDSNFTKKNEKIFRCLCGKIYKYDSGFYRHKKKCINTENIINEIQNNTDNKNNKDELIIMLLKQNSELLEIVKNGKYSTTISNNNSTNNSNNKTFNLHFFLNETCKEAMNINDFIDSIKLQLTDLERVGEIGYIDGISNIITKNLKALDITRRPIHCTDKKREVLYIKDENKWEKEDEDKKRIKKVIKKIASKNALLLPKFKEVHPDCGKSVSKYSDQYNKIIIESMGGIGDNNDEKEDKIIKNITKNVTIDKEIDL